MDTRQSPHYAKFMESIGWKIERVGNINVFIRPIGPVSVVKIQRPTDVSDLSEVVRRVRKYRPLFIKIEPADISSTSSSLRDNQFIKDSWPLVPTKSLVLNLNLNLNSLPKDTRYEIRKAQENSLSVSVSDDTELFYKLLQETMKIGGWSVPIKKEVTNLYKAFQPHNSALLFATVNNEPVSTVNLPVAACLLIWHGDTAHYMYAALTNKGRELGAAYFLLWEAIQFLQKKGLKCLDLEGIYDERYPSHTKHWQGFTKFKMGWNGKVVQYPGSYTKYFYPFLRFFF